MSLLEDGTKPLFIPIGDTIEQLRTDPISPILIPTSDRSQQTSPSKMFPINYNKSDNSNNDFQYQSSVSEDRQSVDSTVKQSNSDEQTSTLAIDDEAGSSHEIKNYSNSKSNKTNPKN